MPASAPDGRRAFAVATDVALALMFVVVAASATIRFSLAADPAAALPIARGVHRAAATLTAVAVLVLAILALRRPALRAPLGLPAAAALVLTLALSALGVATGTTPAPLAKFGNLFGGLALLGLLAWLAGRASDSTSPALPNPQKLTRLARIALVLGVIQAALGAALATLWDASTVIALSAHVLTGFATAALAFALGIRLAGAGIPIGLGLLAAALLAPLAGTVSALLDLAPGAALVHPLLGAATLALIARFDGHCTARQQLA
jgi:hypothetical protein